MLVRSDFLFSKKIIVNTRTAGITSDAHLMKAVVLVESGCSP